MVTGFGSVVRAGAITTIDFPGAILTEAFGVNDAGQIVGSFESASDVYNGFLDNGLFTVDNEGPGGDAFAYGISAGGLVVGTQSYPGFGDLAGFTWFDGGSFSINPGPNTSLEAYGIDTSDQIVGYNVISQQGFLDNGGSFSPPIVFASITVAKGINDSGEIVGFGGSQGFLDIGGVFSPINYPGAISTAANGINNGGLIVGSYEDASGIYHGFLDNGGVFSAIDVPGAMGTYAEGINNSGDIVGYYFDSSGNAHAFLDAPSSSAPEPSSMVLLTPAIVFIVVAAPRKARVRTCDNS
jgi:probable HAF family extracellular repeat protein